MHEGDRVAIFCCRLAKKPTILTLLIVIILAILDILKLIIWKTLSVNLIVYTIVLLYIDWQVIITGQQEDKRCLSWLSSPSSFSASFFTNFWLPTVSFPSAQNPSFIITLFFHPGNHFVHCQERRSIVLEKLVMLMTSSFEHDHALTVHVIHQYFDGNSMETLDLIDWSFLPNLCHTVLCMEFWLSCNPYSQGVVQGLLPWPALGNWALSKGRCGCLFVEQQLPPAVLVTAPVRMPCFSNFSLVTLPC